MIGHKGKERPIAVRFWEKVQKTDSCWNWIGAIDSVGYGSLRINGKTHRCHRLSYELANGPIPDNLCVLHRCDNPRCVNPDHLFLGTMKDNSRDMARKNRCKPHRGETNFYARITEEQVREIRNRYSDGESTRKIARDYPISYSTIWKIVTRKAWSHVE